MYMTIMKFIRQSLQRMSAKLANWLLSNRRYYTTEQHTVSLVENQLLATQIYSYSHVLALGHAEKDIIVIYYATFRLPCYSQY